jgi:hypothetical protein
MAGVAGAALPLLIAGGGWARQDDYFARTGQLIGPLHGIPLAIKDNYDTIDMRTTAGAAADYANDKPPRDATMVAELRAAGAIILGKTNLDEYAPAGIGRSTLGGQSCNPYDTKRIPVDQAGPVPPPANPPSAHSAPTRQARCAIPPPSTLRRHGRNPALVGRAGIVPLSLLTRPRGRCRPWWILRLSSRFSRALIRATRSHRWPTA